MAEKEKTGKQDAAAPAKKIEHPNIYAALSAFQGELKPLPKSKKVSFDTKSGGKMEYNYTSLGEIMEAIYPLLAKHGLSVRHEVVKEGIKDAVVAILTHETFKQVAEEESESKEDIGSERDPRELVHRTTSIRKVMRTENQLRSGPIQIPSGGEMKESGAAITYARRYSLTMVLGISSEDDTDAQLLAASAKNAVQFAYNKAKQGLEGAKTAKDVDKAIVVLKKDLEALKGGKAPALGLNQEQYEDLILFGEGRKAELTNGTTTEPVHE